MCSCSGWKKQGVKKRTGTPERSQRRVQGKRSDFDLLRMTVRETKIREGRGAAYQACKSVHSLCQIQRKTRPRSVPSLQKDTLPSKSTKEKEDAPVRVVPGVKHPSVLVELIGKHELPRLARGGDDRPRTLGGLFVDFSTKRKPAVKIPTGQQVGGGERGEKGGV